MPDVRSATTPDELNAVYKFRYFSSWQLRTQVNSFSQRLSGTIGEQNFGAVVCNDGEEITTAWRVMAAVGGHKDSSVFQIL
jgi:hypothetical protein